MKDTEKDYCRILLNVMEEKGVRDAVASPGTRNAPLLISLSYRENIRTYVVTDERNAAFMALGMALVSRRPVILTCTSGTALYNYAPAIAEAYYQGIPLIIISADRPYDWIDQNDSQTLIQPGALSPIVKKSFDIPVENREHKADWFVNRIANEAVILSMEGKPGPVHINIQFDAPLSCVDEFSGRPERIVSTISPSPFIRPNEMDDLVRRLAGKKIMVIAGFMPPDASLNRSISLFASLPGVVLMCETISNIHIEGNIHAVDNVLSGLSAEKKSELAPDIVISIGGALISGILKGYIREYACEVWTLGDTYFGIDTFCNLSLHIDVAPEFFFKALFYKLHRKYEKNEGYIPTLLEYSGTWKQTREKQLKIREEFINNSEWSELRAFRYILGNIPHDWNLFLSNGTAVRYAQLFSQNLPHACYANRGVSGIEGTNATALGCAIAYRRNTLLITGDMSFAYSPGIMGYDYIPSGFKIVIINNKGGGIFRFISPTRYIEHRDRFFCADPRVPVEGLAIAYGWKYFKADSEEELQKRFPDFISCPENAILEITVDEEYSAAILRKYMRLNAFETLKD